jgi:hypothetical protein
MTSWGVRPLMMPRAWGRCPRPVLVTPNAGLLMHGMTKDEQNPFAQKVVIVPLALRSEKFVSDIIQSVDAQMFDNGDSRGSLE